MKLAEDKAKELGGKIFEAMKAFCKELEKGKDGSKAGEVYGKYTGADAYTQMNDCLKMWAEKSGLDQKWPEEEAAAAPEGMEMAAAADGEMAAEAMEGGVMEGEGAGDMAAAAEKMALFNAESFGDFTPVVDISKLLMALMFLYPVFGDKVKSQVMNGELGGDGGDFAAVAAVTGAYVNAGEKADTPSFGAAWLSGDDLEELQEAAKTPAVSALVFPGLVGAYTTEEDAMGEAGKVEGKTQVLFKF